MANRTSKPWIPGLRFVRDMAHALRDEATYDLRRNPSLWVGFLLAIPIPVLTFAGNAEEWLKLLTLPAPLLWGIIVGAAGRVGMIAKQERDILAGEIKRVAGVAEEAQASLGKEQVKRRALESEREEVESELKLAQAIQTTMFPAPIQRPEVEAVARIIPTRYLGGDYAHFNVIEDHWLYLVLIDVSGHGISASLVVARVHAMIRRLTLTEATPTEMLELLNEASRGLLQHTYFFMTGVMARLDIRTGELEIATAGHPEQILLRADGSLETLQTENRLLGMHEEILDRDQPSLTVQMRPGDSLVLFTDGLFELLEDGKGEVLGESGLRERIEGLGSLSPQLLIGEVLQELAHFQGRSDFDDDVTMLVARYGGGWSEEPGSPPQS